MKTKKIVTLLNYPTGVVFQFEFRTDLNPGQYGFEQELENLILSKGFDLFDSSWMVSDGEINYLTENETLFT